VERKDVSQVLLMRACDQLTHRSRCECCEVTLGGVRAHMQVAVLLVTYGLMSRCLLLSQTRLPRVEFFRVACLAPYASRVRQCVQGTAQQSAAGTCFVSAGSFVQLLRVCCNHLEVSGTPF